jgi:D-alanine-D-alanine ligase
MEYPMLVGFTFDCKDDYRDVGFSEEATAEFDSRSTIEAIEKGIILSGHTVDKIGNISNLVDRLNRGTPKWNFVFNISEGLYGLARESQIPCLLDAYSIPHTFSDASTLAVCHNKSVANSVVSMAGVPAPMSFVVNSVEDVYNMDFQYSPFFVKPLAEGISKGISEKSIVHNDTEAIEVCSDLIKRFNQPALIEEYLTGREFTVGILGTGKDSQVIGTMEIEQKKDSEQGAYTYWNKLECPRVSYTAVYDSDPMVYEAQGIALNAWKALGCKDSGRIDLRADDIGQVKFIECNPLAGISPISDLPMIWYKHTGKSHEELIEEILKRSIKRIFNK